MKDKIIKLFNVIKKDGIVCTIKKIYRYVKSRYLSKINIFSYIDILFNKNKYIKLLDEIFINNDYDRIVIWRSTFGWNVPLFQRPQHISKNLANQKSLLFYEVTTMTDNVKNIKKIYNNLYLVNFNNVAFKKMLLEKIRKSEKPKYIQFYSTDCNMPLTELQQYIKDGYKAIYEYIDDLSPLLIGTKELPKNLLDKYNYILKDDENVFVVVTADEIEKDILSKRGKEKLIYSCNGVDIEHFKNIQKEFKFDKEFTDILNSGKPIIGYYGALASWFDYELIEYLAKKRKDYNIVLFGIKYDDSLEKSNINKYTNIHYLGTKDYSILQNYANKFDVCTIPFLINSITKATSPVKLFEYMALEKPIVTTAMHECKKYKSVMIAKDKEEFVELIDKSLQMNIENDKEYFELLKKEAKENTWNNKALAIVETLKKYENILEKED